MFAFEFIKSAQFEIVFHAVCPVAREVAEDVALTSLEAIKIASVWTIKTVAWWTWFAVTTAIALVGEYIRQEGWPEVHKAPFRAIDAGVGAREAVYAVTAEVAPAANSFKDLVKAFSDLQVAKFRAWYGEVESSLSLSLGY